MGARRDTVKSGAPSYSRGSRYTRYTEARRAVGGRAAAMGRARAPVARPYVTYGQGETKYFDTGIKATITSGTGDWTATEVPCDNYVNSSGTAAAYTDSALNPSAPGVSYGQVSGNRYHMKKLRVRGTLTHNATSNAADMVVGKRYRLMLVHDSAPNTAQAQGEEVMQDVGADETQYSYKRMASQGSRFRILKDQMGVLQNNVAGTDGTNTNSLGFLTAEFSFQYAPTSPINISVKSAAAASAPSIGNLVDGNLFLLLHTNGQAINIVAAARCYYSDK